MYGPPITTATPRSAHRGSSVSSEAVSSSVYRPASRNTSGSASSSARRHGSARFTPSPQGPDHALLAHSGQRAGRARHRLGEARLPVGAVRIPADVVDVGDVHPRQAEALEAILDRAPGTVRRVVEADIERQAADEVEALPGRALARHSSSRPILVESMNASRGRARSASPNRRSERPKP